MSLPSKSSIVFGLVVLLGVAEVSWWILFQFRESQRLEAAGYLLAERRVDEALHELGADETGNLTEAARRRRTMFAWEGAVLGVLVLIGVVFFYSAMHRERRLRRNQERFLTGATHELKTPLTTLRLGLESLAAGTLPPEKRRRYLHDMLVEADRLHAGLTKLLTAAGLESSSRPRLRGGDLADDVRAVVTELRARADTAGIVLRVGDLAACPVSRDEVSLRLALHNLLDNAIKYSGAAAVVSVELVRDGEQARVRVSDTGPGIAADELPHLFERFYRADGHAHVGGTGLGLYLTRTIVEDHGGSVTGASPGLGRGATFEIRLPIARSA